MRCLNYGDDDKISNIEDINFDNGNIIIKLKSLQNNLYLETVIKDKANNKIYNLKREIDILFVEQGKIKRWTFDH